MLGLVHEADKKFIGKKYKWAELMGLAHVKDRIGPG